ncbi:carboxypeptidase-like regulatory domain-containing protein [Hymenobacter busanensis]|uniref:Carboxypeptidase-like regulatory domain-containing protein n=1 Tax=Hymenobacter busanensis TaxID=2607656 RepID=A0A7L4ZUT0_9BACT|nr:carboxypeptidase regulatory-like domain-containing protein [Hymenobacter busanensis]KAA9339542.1 carboxypeptidase-like regulatory domain-containing protein [Hymenobacter busanensis]QHJ06703.1 hypothetical protein GUY19_05070 [Hymenobacter busanensis]
MKTLVARFFFFSLALLAALNLTAGTKTAQMGTISGKLLDGQTQESIPQANVIVLRASDNAYVCSVATRADGSFSVSNLPFGQYRLRTTVLGYQQLRPVFQVNARQPRLALGSVALVPMSAPVAASTLAGTPVSNPFLKHTAVGQATKYVLTAGHTRRYAKRPVVRS